MENDSIKARFQCPKCGNGNCEFGEFRATGGFVTKLLNIQSQRFSTATCTQCQYTEIYKKTTSAAGNVLDFFTN